MKLSTVISVFFVIFAKKILANPTSFKDQGAIFKTAKSCAKLNGLDFMSSTSIYIKGNFKDLKDEQKGFLKCVTEDLKLWSEGEEKPDVDKMMKHIEYLVPPAVRHDKQALREKIETCVTNSTAGSFNDRLHSAYQCFWTSTKGLGRQQGALLDQIKLNLNIDLNKKV